MIRAIALLAVLTLAACQPDPEPVLDDGLAGYDPKGGEIARAACEKKGGSYTKAGASSAMVCVEQTGEGTKACKNGTQCQGLCLARSGTCSPLKPLFGCHDILTDNGSTATICID